VQSLVLLLFNAADCNLSDFFIHCDGVNVMLLNAAEAECHLRLIAEVVPDFLHIISLKSGDYVKIDQHAQLADVHDIIHNIIKAM